MDPKILKGFVQKDAIEYTSKVDLWSIGLIFYFFLTGEYLFEQGSCESVLNQVFEFGKVSKRKLFNGFSDNVRDVLTRLLQTSEKHRISWDDFFQHPVFNQVLSSNPKIDSFISGVQILENLKIEEEFSILKSSLDQTTLLTKQSMQIDFDSSGLDRTMVAKKKSKQTQPLKPYNKKETLNMYNLTIKMQQMNDGYCHEISKYMYVWCVVEKSYYYQTSRLFESVNHLVTEFMYVIVKEKLLRISDICMVLLKGRNFWNVSEEFLHYFNTSKNRKMFYNYFRKMKSLFQSKLRNLGEAIHKNKVQNKQSLLPEKLEKGFKTYENQYYLKIKRRLEQNSNLKNDKVKYKQYKFFIMEVLYTLALNHNFPFMKNNDEEPFCWETFQRNHEKLDIFGITMRERSLYVKNKKDND